MTEKLKCPFCNAELRTNMLDQPVMWYCPNHCIGSYEPKVWKALIDGKNAQDALKSIADDAFLYHPSISEKIPWEEHYYRLKDKAKSAITSITKQDG